MHCVQHGWCNASFLTPLPQKRTLEVSQGNEKAPKGQPRQKQQKVEGPAAAPEPEVKQTFSSLDFGDASRRRHKRPSKAKLLEQAEAKDSEGGVNEKVGKLLGGFRDLVSLVGMGTMC